MNVSNFHETNLILILGVIATGQKTWVDKTCPCSRNTPLGVRMSMTPITTWSACKDWPDEDGDDPGCYSALQERTLECNYESMGDSKDQEVQSLHSCLEYRRCLAGTIPCDGYWGQWSDNGPCNRTSKKRTQSRYCNRKTGHIAVKQPVVSIHCVGSGGYFEQNRTVNCCSKEIDCATTAATSTKQSLPAKRNPENTTNLASIFRSTNVTSRLPLLTNTNDEGGKVSTRKQSLIIAIAAVGVAFLALVTLVATCVMRGKKADDKKAETAHETESSQPFAKSRGMRESTQYTANSLYGRFPQDGEDTYNLPYHGISTPRDTVTATISPTTTEINGSWSNSVIDSRDRNATTSGVDHFRGNQSDDKPGLSAVILLPSGNERYSVPMDHPPSDDENIYCSIDEATRSKTQDGRNQSKLHRH